MIGRLLVAVLLVCGLGCLPAHAQEVGVCLDGSVHDGDVAVGACGQIGYMALPSTLSSSALIIVCRGSAVVSASPPDCFTNGGGFVWSAVSSVGASDQVAQGPDADHLTMVSFSSLSFGSGGSGAAVPFDVSTLDKGQLTSYFTWGWFIVALGWISGKGVSLFVQFVKHI